MDTHRLRYFLRAADEGSITRAAAALGIAQSALSRQIRLLEDELGLLLFHRSRRGIELTEDGQRLRAATAAPLRQLELAVQYAGSPSARLDRGVVLGVLDTAAELVSAPLLGQLARAFPDVEFSLVVGATDRLVESMLRGSVDIALLNPVPDDRVFYRELLIEELVLIGGPGSGLDPGQPVTFQRAAELPLVVPRSPSGIAAILDNAALRTKSAVRQRFSTDAVNVGKQLIGSGLAYGILPLSACSTEIDRGLLRFAPIMQPVLHHRLGAAATAQLDLPREISVEMGRLLRQSVSDLVGSGRWRARFVAPEQWEPRSI